jgi:hypothetical protein
LFQRAAKTGAENVPLERVSLIRTPFERGLFEIVMSQFGQYPGPNFKSELRGMPDIPFEKREEYVGYATLCLKLAKVTTDNKSREIFKAMAAEWLRLAEAAV